MTDRHLVSSSDDVLYLVNEASPSQMTLIINSYSTVA